VKTLHLYFKVHFTIVSQVNPHVVMFFYHAKGSAGKKKQTNINLK